MPATASASIQDDVAALLPLLRSFARRFLASQTDVDDLTQETMVKMLAHIESFTPGTSLRSWGFTIMRNTFINEYRRRKRFIPMPDVSEACDVLAPANQQGVVYAADVRRAVARLPATQRQALVLFLSGSSYEAAAKACQCEIGTIKSRISRARSGLVKVLGEESTAEAAAVR